MSDWSLPQLFDGLHKKVNRDLEIARETFSHPVTKGDASESIWLRTLQTYLPERYQVESAHVVDSQNNFSDQIDVLIFDRQYSPFIFEHEGNMVVPAESVYAAFEAKQTINAELIAYAQKKIASVRCLQKTSLPIPHAGGVYPPKPPIHIIGGIVSLDSDWNPALGDPLNNSLLNEQDEGRLDIGCASAHGYFWTPEDQTDYEMYCGEKSATAFIFRLISQLQLSGTVPMIDIQAYAKWL
jgi:hypothetical protein